MMLASINTDKGTITLVSFMRDSRVHRIGKSGRFTFYSRLNGAYSGGYAGGGPGELFRDSVYPKNCFGSLGLALERLPGPRLHRAPPARSHRAGVRIREAHATKPETLSFSSPLFPEPRHARTRPGLLRPHPAVLR